MGLRLGEIGLRRWWGWGWDLWVACLGRLGWGGDEGVNFVYPIDEILISIKIFDSII